LQKKRERGGRSEKLTIHASDAGSSRRPGRGKKQKKKRNNDLTPGMGIEEAKWLVSAREGVGGGCGQGNDARHCTHKSVSDIFEQARGEGREGELKNLGEIKETALEFSPAPSKEKTKTYYGKKKRCRAEPLPYGRYEDEPGQKRGAPIREVPIKEKLS